MNQSKDMNNQCKANIEDTAKAKPKEADDANANQYLNRKLREEWAWCTQITQLSTRNVKRQPEVVVLKAVCTKKCMDISKARNTANLAITHSQERSAKAKA